MQPIGVRSRSLAIALMAVVSSGGASLGCAELGRSAPALTIEGVAIERARTSGGDGAGVTMREASRWSWAFGASLSGRLGEGRGRIEPDERPARRDVRRAPPCRVAAACAWEARARVRALARMRSLLEVSR